MSDPRLLNKQWRRDHLWYIKNKNERLIKFKQNAAQKHFNENKWSRNIVLKSRQLGFTTEEAIDMLDDTAFTKNFDSLLIAQDLDTAKDIFSNKIDLAWRNFILKDRYKVNNDSARQIKLDLGKNTISSITVDSSGRSGTFRRVHITEFALVCKKYPDKAKEIITGTIPAVPIDGRVDIESTAADSSGKFYDMFWEAWEIGQPTLPVQFKAHFYNWQWDHEEIKKVTPEQIKEFLGSKDFIFFKEYQERYKLTDLEITYYYFKWLSLNRDWNELKKEYPTTPWEAFVSSGNKLFDENALSKFEIRPPIRQENQFEYFSEPILGHKYALGADVGEGIGQDHSTISLWDLSTVRPQVVATYANNKIAPDLFAYEIKDVATKYHYAYVAVERNNHGHTTISKLREIYPEELIFKDDKDRFGWQTNLVSKPKMMYDLNTASNNDLIDIPSHKIVSEMRRYDKEDLRVKKYDDEMTEHFDLLTATAIGFQMKDYATNENNVAVVQMPLD